MVLAVEPATLVVPTKLAPPRTCADSLVRPRLALHLRAALAHPLTVLCAPGGFGKTTLLASMLADSPWPVAWLALDPEDSHLPTFLRVLAAAVQQACPGACHTALSLLQLPTLPPSAAIARAVQHDLAELSDDLVLVLDDYHLIAEPAVHALVAALLRHPAPRLHLVVASRELPPWPLARLRAAGQTAELGADDLRFTLAETQAFLTGVAFEPVSEETVAVIHARTDGWAVGLRLAALALRDRSGSPPAAAALEGRSWQHVMQYLLEEIVAQQPPDVQRFLQRTAIVDRISAPLADALMDGTAPTLNSGRLLAHLEQVGLFVSAVDEERDWYRYHDLFREALLHALRLEHDRAEVAALHRRASAWLARAGRITEALRHALAGGDVDGAAGLVEAQAPALLDRGEWQRLEEYLGLLPAEVVEQRPALLLAQAWIAFFRFRAERMPAPLQRASKLLEPNTCGLSPERVAALRAEVDALWATYWYLQGDAARAAPHAERGWEDLPATAAFARSHAGGMLGLCKHRLGQPDAVEHLLAAERALALENQPASTRRLRATQALVHYARGDLHRAERTARQAIQQAQREGFDYIAASAHYVLGRVYYAWDDLDAAEQQFTAVVDRRHLANRYALCGSLQGLALIGLALGGSPTALPAVQPLLALTQGAWDVDEEAAGAFEARLALVQGDLETARHWLQATQPAASCGPTVAFEQPGLTRAQTLLAWGTEPAVAEARRLLDQLLEAYSARHDTPCAIETLAVQAAAHQAQGTTEAALATLERAVQLAAPGGFVRPFLDVAPPLTRLLAELARRNSGNEYISRLLAAFDAHRQGCVSAVPSRECLPVELIEPLTEREREVLRYLDGRLSNKEIASALHISWQTVTKHTVNIYQKLQVRDRREAVRRARALALIPPVEATDRRGDAPLRATTRSIPPEEPGWSAAPRA